MPCSTRSVISQKAVSAEHFWMLPFGIGEITTEAVQQAVEHNALAAVEPSAGMFFQKSALLGQPERVMS